MSERTTPYHDPCRLSLLSLTPALLRYVYKSRVPMRGDSGGDRRGGSGGQIHLFIQFIVYCLSLKIDSIERWTGDGASSVRCGAVTPSAIRRVYLPAQKLCSRCLLFSADAAAGRSVRRLSSHVLAVEFIPPSCSLASIESYRLNQHLITLPVQ